MGYYTSYALEVLEEKADPKAEKLKEFLDGGSHADQIAELSGYGEMLWDDSVKWYSSEKDMRSYSKKFPDVLFKLSGDGEDSLDMWVQYYKNGKMQECLVDFVYEEYDESKLK